MATITQADSNSWNHQDGTTASQGSGPHFQLSRWESLSSSLDDTFDTSSDLPYSSTTDFRSAAWRELAPEYMMIKWNNQVLFTPLYSLTSCFNGAESLAAFFGSLDWNCGGSENVQGCSQTCFGSGNGLSGEDALSLGSTFEALYFKSGEKDGVQDGNKKKKKKVSFSLHCGFLNRGCALGFPYSSSGRLLFRRRGVFPPLRSPLVRLCDLDWDVLFEPKSHVWLILLNFSLE